MDQYEHADVHNHQVERPRSAKNAVDCGPEYRANDPDTENCQGIERQEPADDRDPQLRVHGPACRRFALRLGRCDPARGRKLFLFLINRRRFLLSSFEGDRLFVKEKLDRRPLLGRWRRRGPE